MTANRLVTRVSIGVFVLASIGMLLVYYHRTEMRKVAGLAYMDGSRAADHGDLATAIRKFTQATDADPKLCSGYFNRGDAYERFGRLDDAVMSFELAQACMRGTSPHGIFQPYSKTTLELDLRRTSARIVEARSRRGKPSALVDR